MGTCTGVFDVFLTLAEGIVLSQANSLYIMETDITSTRPTGLQALMYRELPLQVPELQYLLRLKGQLKQTVLARLMVWLVEPGSY